MPLDLPGNAMVGLTRDALVALRSVLFREAGGNAAAYLQEAGYAGGKALFKAFTKWCASLDAPGPDRMTAEEFERRAPEFFAELGWGSVVIGMLHESVMTVDASDWAEADPASDMDYPGCYLSAGLLAEFFGRIAGTPLAAMEVECRSMGDGNSRCRFLLGSTETMQHVYEEMMRGVGYEDALQQMA